MQKQNAIQEKSYRFAVKIVLFCRTLESRREYVLSRQLLGSGTSIGANVEEALQAQSKRDFIAKLSIALKEAFETQYWLRLIRDTKTEQKESAILMVDCEEIMKILTSIVKTMRSQYAQS